MIVNRENQALVPHGGTILMTVCGLEYFWNNPEHHERSRSTSPMQNEAGTPSKEIGKFVTFYMAHTWHVQASNPWVIQ